MIFIIIQLLHFNRFVTQKIKLFFLTFNKNSFTQLYFKQDKFKL